MDYILQNYTGSRDKMPQFEDILSSLLNMEDSFQAERISMAFTTSTIGLFSQMKDRNIKTSFAVIKVFESIIA